MEKLNSDAFYALILSYILNISVVKTGNVKKKTLWMSWIYISIIT